MARHFGFLAVIRGVSTSTKSSISSHPWSSDSPRSLMDEFEAAIKELDSVIPISWASIPIAVCWLNSATKSRKSVLTKSTSPCLNSKL
ncbi:hypothetical protein OGAPHI_002490 [Ogataea philodendri]|uniref:Uncharacterized protein n=1 Tax=Ogataea philodendri TaxID=1378263 RepID=A0A9P8T819_9ASCO|nr:uncharacterized protein OGAPHI_002490 [Ogataea philodendri]KAH3668735.1 hypothetical protein OGAPHI_002490 [Ogataea philodendri]